MHKDKEDFEIYKSSDESHAVFKMPKAVNKKAILTIIPMVVLLTMIIFCAVLLSKDYKRNEALENFEYTILENGDVVVNSIISVPSNGKLTIPNEVTIIGEKAFEKTKIVSIELPNNIKEIQQYAFSNCTNLKTIIINNDSITIGEGAFYNCVLLTEVELPSGLTEISDYLFAYCRNLQKVNIPSSVQKIGSSAFHSCRITDINFPNNLETIGSFAFFSCNELTNISIPKSVKMIGEAAFPSKALETITVEEGNPCYYSIDNCLIETRSKSLVKGCTNSKIPNDGSISLIGSNAFSYSNIKHIYIPKSIVAIGESAFSSCSKLESVDIPLDSELLFIVDDAFSFSNIQTIIIPTSLVIIGKGVFLGCDTIKNVFYMGTENQWSLIGIDILNDDILNATKYYYSEEEPSSSGNYWHFDSDGVTPIIW